MSEPNENSHLPKLGLAARVDELRESLKLVPPGLLDERTGASYHDIGPGRGEFRLPLIDAPIIVTFPDFRVLDADDNELPLFFQTMLMYYFDSPGALPVAGRWISFADLPEGRVYDSAFQNNTGNALVKAYGQDVESLHEACGKLAGEAISGYGDVAFVFQALPHIPIMVNYWQGDEDFPSTCKLLFDESIGHYLPTEACAILGGMLARKLIESIA